MYVLFFFKFEGICMFYFFFKELNDSDLMSSTGQLHSVSTRESGVWQVRLQTNPENVSNNVHPNLSSFRNNESQVLSADNMKQNPKRKQSLSNFYKALLIEFSVCLLFVKLVAYTFIFWTPYYLVHNGFSVVHAGYLCTFVDIGGIFGSILAGLLRDMTRKPACVSFGFLILSIPGLLTYRYISIEIGDKLLPNVFLMLFVGVLINGPYALINSESANIDYEHSNYSKGKLMATVTGIVDGTGSIGAAIQGVAIGAISTYFGWNYVFYFLMFCCLMASACLIRLVVKEIRKL
eukprot:GSMAST32.ASY1.ANO1.955.1 assembled CDS